MFGSKCNHEYATLHNIRVQYELGKEHGREEGRAAAIREVGVNRCYALPKPPLVYYARTGSVIPAYVYENTQEAFDLLKQSFDMLTNERHKLKQTVEDQARMLRGNPDAQAIINRLQAQVDGLAARNLALTDGLAMVHKDAAHYDVSSFGTMVQDDGMVRLYVYAGPFDICQKAVATLDFTKKEFSHLAEAGIHQLWRGT